LLQLVDELLAGYSQSPKGAFWRTRFGKTNAQSHPKALDNIPRIAHIAVVPVYLPPISRRRFLSGSFAAAAALALGQGCALPNGKRDENNVALLSDIHIAADPQKIERHVNMTDNLRTVMAEVMAWPQQPGTVFINGDLAFDDGEKSDYAAVLGLLRPLREAGLPIHLGMGNHDNRENFWSVLRPAKTVQPNLPGRQAAIVRTERANWFVLDSLIQTRTTPGLLGDMQRAWLAAALDANANKPALIMIHHQPGPPAPGKKFSGLEDAAELLAILRPRRQVKAWFFGHTHRWDVRQDESGIHLINLPTTAYLFEEGPPNGWVHASVQESGARLELRCVDHGHKDHGQVVNLAWRNA
jgi:3',5'-cyclic-AMP phosphodiesterase